MPLRQTNPATLCATVLSGLLGATAPAAWADAALQAPDGHDAEAGTCELEVAFDRSRTPGSPRVRGNGVQLVCGIGWDTELTLAASRQRGGGERVDQRALELKTALVPQREGAIGWAVLGALADEREGGQSWRLVEYALAVEATAEPAPDWLIEAQLGWARDKPARIDRMIWTLAAERALFGPWAARIELEGDDRDPPLATAQLHWAFWPERAHLELGIGRRLGGDRERAVGVTVVFGF